MRVAKMYYELDMTQSDIAQELDLSRVKVTRMLARARQQGIVTISIKGDVRPYEDLEKALVEKYGLKAARVVPIRRKEAPANDHLFREGAMLLAQTLVEDSTIAIGASRIVAQIPAFIGSGFPQDISFVPASGGYAGADRILNPDHVAQLFADCTHGQSYALAIPLVGLDANVASVLARSKAVDEVLDRAKKAEVFLSGVGSEFSGGAWKRAVLAPEVSETELTELARGGAVSDVSGRFFDGEGRAVMGGFDQRVVGLSLADMRRIPTRIVMTEGRDRSAPLVTALSTGIFNVAVVDRENAKALLAAS
ncbi:sugar-binding domain-containing protein [Trueperella pyogenes]|uniref:sugar-binding transcriptional regulator n=1 Tax=Trueperella pyogenes TaxID=1661 RepID=UPI00345D7701